MKGRHAIPTALDELHGRPSKTKANPLEPRPEGDLVDPPARLNAEQRTIWQEGVASSPPGLLKTIDTSVFESWVIAVDTFRRAAVEFQGQPMITTARNGVKQQNQLLSIINRQSDMIKKLTGELGFSPVSRPRVGVVGQLSYRPGAALPGRAPAMIEPPRRLDEFLDTHPASN